jgi:hypothetical protein
MIEAGFFAFSRSKFSAKKKKKKVMKKIEQNNDIANIVVKLTKKIIVVLFSVLERRSCRGDRRAT